MMTGLNNITGKVFPAWEQSVSSVETGRSQRGNSLNAAGISSAFSASMRHHGGAWLRCVVMLLLMVLGVGEMWGQDTPDYSGTYYIRSGGVRNQSSGEYYLCPTVEWAYFYDTNDLRDVDNGQPFLTTHHMENGDYARYKWIIEKHTIGDNNYYAFKYSIDYVEEGSSYSRYLSYNRKLTNASNVDRMRIHLKKTDSQHLTDYELFTITETTQTINKKQRTYLVISPLKKDEDNGNKLKYLVVNGGNTDAFGSFFPGNNIGTELYVLKKDNGPSPYTLTTGIIGTYENINDDNAPFYLDEVIARPEIRFDNETNEVTISTTTSGATIYYTMGENPADPTSADNGHDGSGESGSSTVTIPNVTNPTTIKAIATKGSYPDSEVATKTITKVATPTINLNYENGTYTVTLACETTDAAIFYRIGESGDFKPYSIPFTVANNSIIFAYATKDECIKSERSSLTARATCATPSITISYNDGTATVTITNNENDATIHYTTDGSVPDVNSQSTPLTFNVTSDDITSGMTVRAIAVKTDYNNSDIAEETVNQVAMPVIAIVNNEITISCETVGAAIYYTVNGGSPIEYTHPLGLSDNVSGKTITAYATKTGMVTSATAVADASTTKLQMPTPVITYDPATNKVIITSTTGATITYTTGKTETEAGDPTEEYTYGNTGFVLPNYHHVIKAKAEMSDEDPSDVAILTITVQTTTDTNNPIPYLIQSVECTDFYMLPGDSKGVNTSSLGRPSMEWCFYYAGKSEGSGDAGVAYDYYYIKNKETDQYVYFIFKDNKTTLRLDSKETFEAADATGRNNYKYRLVYVDDATNPGYYIHPYTSGTAVNGLIKTNGNNAADAIGLASGTDKNTARWNFVPSSDITSLAPQLKSWGSDSRKYYQIKNGSNNLLPRTATSSYATASTATENNLWYFDEIESDKWVTYYYIVNATTGEYLYFNGGNADANSNAFEATEELGTGGDRYQFAFAKTITSDQYYILPKSLINRGKNSYRLVYWDGIFPLSTAANRAASEGKWTLTESAVNSVCPPRITLDADGKVNLASRTRRATISYTIDDGNETTFSTNPIKTMAEGGEKVVINTTTAVGEGERMVTTTKEVTVVYKPDIVFDPEQTIVYNGGTRVPVLSSVIFGDTDYKDYCMVLSDAINAGDATALITQKENYPFHAGSYHVIYGTEAFTIDQSPLTITADATTMEYGEQVPTEFTFSTSGLAYTDIVNVHLVCTTADNSSLGSYPITFTESVQDVTITRQGTNVKNNYKDITLIPSTLTVTPKRIGDGVVPAENISITYTGTDPVVKHTKTNVEPSEEVTLTEGADENADADYYIIDGAENPRKEVIKTIYGIGNYTGAAQVALIKPTFVTNKGETATEYIAAFNGSVDWVPTATEWGVDNVSKNIWMITSVIPSVNIVTAVPITYLPKDMPVILTSGANESNGIYVVPKSSETESISDVDRNRNLLKMTPAGGLEVENGEVYVFYDKVEGNNEIGTGEFVLALAGRVPAGRFYIENPNYTPTGVQGAPARLRIIFGESTVSGITELQNDESTESQNGAWYSIDGRRLNGKPSAKGLYIVDGKKVMVK